MRKKYTANVCVCVHVRVCVRMCLCVVPFFSFAYYQSFVRQVHVTLIVRYSTLIVLILILLCSYYFYCCYAYCFPNIIIFTVMSSTLLLLLSFLLCNFFFLYKTYTNLSCKLILIFSDFISYLFQSLCLSSVHCHVNSLLVRK